ncbi:hypothetical protein [Clostridium sp.]|uniref:hypothetical protein n=1 Tax=Clostridium sp. TaxID=1506 RepID=UPI0026301E63|nr:hypothetical protein [uncultured Clostridium sp.]
MDLTNNEKLELINSIEVLKCADGFNEKAFAFTYDNNKNRKILYELGMTEEEVNFECRGCGVLDLINIGLRYAKAFSKDKGFYSDTNTNYEFF